MHRFWIKILLLTPIPLLVVGFNWFIDPVHLRGANQYEYGIARLILEGKRVTNISNPNEAAYLKFFVDGLKARKDVLVFGSSRSKLIRSDSFPGCSLFNNSIGGAGLVDYLAIYQMYRNNGLTPSVAVVELSPWILKRDYASVWKAFNSQKQMLEQQVLSESTINNVKIQIHNWVQTDLSEFLSLGYFQTSFYTWLRGSIHSSDHKSTYFVWEDGSLSVGETLLADGSTIYPESIQNQKEQERVTALAIEYAQTPIGLPDDLDRDQERILEAFLDRLHEDGVRTVLYLPPYHPRTYTLMLQSKPNRIIVEVQQYFEKLARRKGLTLIGSYNAADVSLDDTAFFDGSHPTPEATRQLFATHELGVCASPPTQPPASTQIELTGVQNPNGLEVVNGKPYFWIGKGDTCLNIRSSRAGDALITLHAEAGPSAPETRQRSLLLKTARGYSRSVLIKQYPEVAISFPVEAGFNAVCLTPLDKPTVLQQSNGDQRPLLIGVSNLQIKLLPEDAIPPDGTVFSFQFVSGWHAIEHSGPDWLCWSDGHGRLSVQTEKNTRAILSGEILSVPRPNNIALIVNGEKVKTFVVDWREWAFHSFEPLRFGLKPGQNTIEFVSQEPPIVQKTDPRPLAVAIKNLNITEVHGR